MRPSLEIDGFACLGLALLLLTLPLGWVLAAGFAAVFHELCHMAAIVLTGGKIHTLRIGVRGAEIRTGPFSVSQELICALAGPAGSLLLLMLLHWLPAVALCGLIQGIYNLLPVYPLDGGRILQACLTILFNERKAAAVCRTVSRILRTVFAVFCFLIFFFLEGGILFLILAFLPLSGGSFGKFSCKEPFQRVQ